MKMKKITILAIFCIANVQFLFPQQTNTVNSLKDEAIGTRKYYIIKSIQGTVYHARIISIDSKMTFIMDSDGKTYVVNTDDVISVTKKAYNSPVSLGLGFGMPYGLFGVNSDFNVYNNLYFSLGLGVGFGSFPWYCFGGKYYLRSGGYKWRPRILAYYGNFGGIKSDAQGSLPKIRESMQGFTIGLGQQWMVGIKKTWGIDFDFIYLLESEKFDKRIEEFKNQGYQFDMSSNGSVKISLGVRYIF